VFHFAALTGVGQGGHEMRAYVDTNVLGVSTVLECIARDGLPVRRLVLASSRAVYGEGDHVCAVHGRVHPAGRREADLAAGEFDLFCPICSQPMAPAPTPEDRPLQPLSIYGWTKKLQEEHCAFAAAQFGLKVACLRYFNVYGERQSLRNAYTGVIPAFVERLLAEQPIPLYEHGRPLRDFVHVSDVVQANLRAIEADLPDLVAINVGSGRDSSILDIARAVAGALGLRPSFEDRGEYRVGDVFACTADLDRARRLLDYRPRMTLEAGLALLVGWVAGEERPQNPDIAAAELRRFGMLRQAASGGDRG
jgi:dTDP-L-rhamnose 4-epimerase